MNVKIDTKEKFHEIKVLEHQLTANMTAELYKDLSVYVQKDVKNIILVLSDVESIDNGGAEGLVSLQQHFYDEGASFVICEVQPQVEQFLDEAQLLETMNLTPTVSEAWDIVQMEEIEREFM